MPHRWGGSGDGAISKQEFELMLENAYSHLVWYARRVHFRVFLQKSKFCSINGHPKQYILVDTIFNYRFHLGLPGKCLYLSPRKGAFPGLFLKTLSRQSKMKPVVKYSVYQDILLRVSIYGTKCRFCKEHTEMLTTDQVAIINPDKYMKTQTFVQ